MGEITPSRYTVNCGWDDVPHLDEKTKRELLDSTQPFLRDARSKGIPSLGAGAIYPVSLEDVLCDPFQIPQFWKRGYGLDVGWRKTAAVWMAEDPSDGVRYVFSEYYRGEAPPSTHAVAVRARGEWMTGAIDPAARGRGQRDGEQLFSDYHELGLNVVPGVNAVEAGLHAVWQRLETGRMKIFRTCKNMQAEYQLYRRDEKGRVVKTDDHLMDAWRMAEMTFDLIAAAKPADSHARNHTSPADRRVAY